MEVPATSQANPAGDTSRSGETLFYVVSDEQEKGPHTAEQIVKLWENGVLTGNAQLRSSANERLQDVAGFVAQQKGIRTTLKAAFAIGGILLGAFIGYLAAHNFPLWGGFAMLGEAHSRARDSLVPGHIAVCALVLGIIGFGIAHLKNARVVGGALLLVLGTAAGVVYKNPDAFRTGLSAERSKLPTKLAFRQKIAPFSVQSGGRQRISPARLVEITGKPQRQQRIDDQVYWYFDCRDGVVQLVLDGDALAQGWALITSINEY
jgi:hypothetical protein